MSFDSFYIESDLHLIALMIMPLVDCSHVIFVHIRSEAHNLMCVLADLWQRPSVITTQSSLSPQTFTLLYNSCTNVFSACFHTELNPNCMFFWTCWPMSWKESFEGKSFHCFVAATLHASFVVFTCDNSESLFSVECLCWIFSLPIQFVFTIFCGKY